MFELGCIMNFIRGLIAFFLIGIVSAQASNLPSMDEKLSLVWEGGYLGANLGIGDNQYRTQTDENDNKDYGKTGKSSFLIGGFAGYNHNVADRLIFGFDVNVLNRVFMNNTNKDISQGAKSVKNQWDLALRLRLGYGAGQVLPYVAVGPSVVQIFTSDDDKGKLSYGVTLGAGVDGILTDHILVRLEYRYNDWGGKHLVKNAEENKLKSYEWRVGFGYKF